MAQLAPLRPRDGDQRSLAVRQPSEPLGVEDAVAVVVEHVLVAEGARQEAFGQGLDLFAGQQAGVVLVQREDLCAPQVEGQGVHVPEVEHELLVLAGDQGVLESAQGGGGPGVQEHGGRIGCRRRPAWRGRGSGSRAASSGR